MATKTKVDTILDEYKAGQLGSKTPVPDAIYKKGSPQVIWAAIDMAFQAIDELNKRLKAKSTSSHSTEDES